MAWLHQILGFDITRYGYTHGAGTVCNRNAGLNTLGSLDRYSEIRTIGSAVAVGHQGQLETAAVLLGEREAHQSASVGHHEVDRLRRNKFSGHHQVTLVFAVLFVDQNDHASGT